MIIPNYPTLTETIQTLVIPGFTVVLIVLAMLALIIHFSGKLFIRFNTDNADLPSTASIAHTLPPKEIAAVAAAAYTILKTSESNDRIVSIEKKT